MVKAQFPIIGATTGTDSEEEVEGGEQEGPGLIDLKTLWRDYSPVLLVALLSLSITFYFYDEVSGREQDRAHSAFREAAQDRILVIRREIEKTLATIHDIASYFDISTQISHQEFRKIVEPAIKRRKGIKTLGWIPRVEEQDRDKFVREARNSFPQFSIVETSPSGEVIRAGTRDVYLPILYVQPFAQNRDLVGLDMSLDPTVLRLLSKSSQSGQLKVSEHIQLKDEPGEHNGIVVAVPVYQKWRIGEDNVGITELQPQLSDIRGFALGVIRIRDVVELALESLSPSGVNLQFFENIGTANEFLVYSHHSRLRSSETQGTELSKNPDGFVHRQSLWEDGLNWEVVCTPVANKFKVDVWGGWMVVGAGISFTLLLTIYVATMVGGAKKVKRQVDIRTSELSSAIEALSVEIMERKSIELELKTLNEDLEYWVAIRSSEATRRARDLEQFAYVASHDLKAPLRAIDNLAEWIGEDLEEKLNDDTREQLNLLQDRVRRMNDLIDGLLEYSRVGRTEGSHTEVDTRALLNEILDSLAPAKGFKVKIQKNLPVFRTNHLLLGQVFSNLISNSLKHHGGEKGHIRIACKDVGAFYEFSVSDDGIGISPEYQDKVFLIFQTLQAKDYGSNTGIGLALVKKIVEEQGGQIKLESDPGQGATFRFTWPKESSESTE